MPRIIVCDHIHKKGLEILENAKDIEYINIANEPKDKVPELIKGADIAITRSSTDVDVNFLTGADKLKAVVRAGVGVERELQWPSTPIRPQGGKLGIGHTR